MHILLPGFLVYNTSKFIVFIFLFFVDSVQKIEIRSFRRYTTIINIRNFIIVFHRTSAYSSDGKPLTHGSDSYLRTQCLSVDLLIGFYTLLFYTKALNKKKYIHMESCWIFISIYIFVWVWQFWTIRIFFRQSNVLWVLWF